MRGHLRSFLFLAWPFNEIVVKTTEFVSIPHIRHIWWPKLGTKDGYRHFGETVPI
jgi:hypothetical protein